MLLLSLAQAPTSSAPVTDQETAVRRFVDAFNARDIDAMLAAADDGIEWASVDGPKVTIETSGKGALRDSMQKYFAQCPSCKSSLEWTKASGSRVAARERASWTSASGPRAQTSLSVYEFRAGKIARVYYFPVERD